MPFLKRQRSGVFISTKCKAETSSLPICEATNRQKSKNAGQKRSTCNRLYSIHCKINSHLLREKSIVPPLGLLQTCCMTCSKSVGISYSKVVLAGEILRFFEKVILIKFFSCKISSTFWEVLTGIMRNPGRVFYCNFIQNTRLPLKSNCVWEALTWFKNTLKKKNSYCAAERFPQLFQHSVHLMSRNTMLAIPTVYI